MHPNSQIRFGIATFICNLANQPNLPGKITTEKTNINIAKQALFPIEDIYSDLRLLVQPFFLDHFQSEVMSSFH